MATLKDIAKKAGVSIATVSYVLNGRGSVSSEVRRRVLRMSEELGYRPNRSAQTLRTGQSRTIGLILPNLNNPFFPALAQVVENTARNENYAVILVDANEDPDAEQEGFLLLDGYAVDGAIWCPVGNGLPPEGLRYPIVIADRPVEGYDNVRSDFEKAGVLLAEFAIHGGYGSVGILHGPHDLISAKLRHESFLRAAEGRLHIAWQLEVPFGTDVPLQATEMLEASPVDLVIAANDAVAIGVLRTLSGLGRRVPEDTSVIGFDDIPWASLVQPRLTTIRQATSDMGREAVCLLVRKLREPDLPPQKIILDVELVLRASTRRSET